MNTTTPLIELQQTAGNPPTALDPLQTLLAPHVDAIIAFWFALWIATGIFLLHKLLREYGEQKAAK